MMYLYLISHITILNKNLQVCDLLKTIVIINDSTMQYRTLSFIIVIVRYYTK